MHHYVQGFLFLNILEFQSTFLYTSLCLALRPKWRVDIFPYFSSSAGVLVKLETQ